MAARGGSTADSAATINYSVQQTDGAYIYDVSCGVDSTKVKVALDGNRLTFALPKKKQDSSSLGDIRQLKLPRAALLEWGQIKVEPRKGSGGIMITVPKQ